MLLLLITTGGKIMNIKSEISRQFQSLRSVFIFLQIPAGIILFLLLFLKLKFDIDTEDLTRDVNALAGLPPYAGIVSNLGVLFWCASATVSLFAGLIGKRKGLSIESFLIYSGILSVVLMLDDLFLLHEEVFPENLHIPEKLVFAIYGILAVAIFFQHRKIILSTNYLILLTCTMFLGLSVFVDVFFNDFRGEDLVEDGAKIIGIMTWFGYYATLGYETIKQKISVT